MGDVLVGLRDPNGRVRVYGAEERTCGQRFARRATGGVDKTLESRCGKCRKATTEVARHPVHHRNHPGADHREMDITWWRVEKIDGAGG